MREKYTLEQYLEMLESEGSNPTVLMNMMEYQFDIPMINDDDWNEKNKEVIKMYRKISDARNL